MIYEQDIKIFANLLQDKINKNNEKLPNNQPTKVRIFPGKKYYKVMVNNSGKFMLNTKTGNLFYITGYGIPNYEKNFGYLPEIVEKGFDWDGYSIVPKGAPKSVNGWGGQIARPRGNDE